MSATIAIAASALAASFVIPSSALPTATAGSTATARLDPTALPVLVDPAASLAPGADRLNESWYLTAHVTAGRHRYAFLAHYLAVGNGQFGLTASSVSVTDETTGWYTASNVALGPKAGLSNAPGVDIHTPNITWTGDSTQMNLVAKVPEGQISVTLRPRGPVLYNMGTGYFAMFGEPQYPNYEYAYPTIDTTGTLTLNGHTDKISGESWFDRQWGPGPDISTGDATWTWMNPILPNGDKISLWSTIDKGKTATWATVLRPDGTHTIAEATITPDTASKWTSPATQASYITRWKVTIPGVSAALNVRAVTNNQELTVPGPRYEGSATVTGIYKGLPVTGICYVEQFASR
ncbi:lipocalin-like domain-containing protein [Frankia sp. CcI49]|uniref:lipocalin-like domain-containing protein n=1 Tax=Frankia sp. CcI49 TaxID=1745382 RepID=UPI000E2FC2EB|nr:lipocalin-like domain-containing protein [Frankia sp. CcI49]